MRTANPSSSSRATRGIQRAFPRWIRSRSKIQCPCPAVPLLPTQTPDSLPLEMHSVSILIPCYQERNFIRPCLESVQGFEVADETTFEILVLDGMSVDGTR